MHPITSRASTLLLPLLFLCHPVLSAAPRALTPGTPPDDQRRAPLKDLNGYFPFTPPGSAQDWLERSGQVRQRILVSLGLWPMPDRTPLNPVIHGLINQGDYTVEKVYFESIPGFYVTGSLYRPANPSQNRPAVLSPHGHWADGRFYDNKGGIADEIKSGAEQFTDGGRSPLQARCVQLARMGCVVFHYDMIGYADCQQIPSSIAHGFAKQRPEMNSDANPGLFSPQAESRFQSVMGLQTWNSIRALDFLASLPDVDPKRIAVTGASGGGTQTFILCAIDPRPAVSFPAVMVSTAMQGGCTCENACNLRIDTGNVEFAALFAPKPLGLTAADDWTREMETKGFPELKKLYATLGAPDQVQLTARLQFGHNYNAVSRGAMYHWLNQHLGLGITEPIAERAYPRLSAEELTVWNNDHPRPAGGPEFEKELLQRLHEDATRKLDQATHAGGASFRELTGPALNVIIGRDLPHAGKVEMTITAREQREGYLEMTGLLRNTTHHEELPAVFLHPENWNKRSVLWIDPRGKAALYDGDQPAAHVGRLLKAGISVASVDLLFQGEFREDGTPLTRTRRVANNRESAAYTFGYNPTLFARRVHDILSTIRFMRDHERGTRTVELVGLAGAGHWVAAARAQAGAAVDRAVIDTGGFRFGNVRDLHDPDFLPGGAKYGDLPGMLAMAAPAPVHLAGEGNQVPRLTAVLYEQAGAAGNLETFNGSPTEAAAWLISR